MKRIGIIADAHANIAAAEAALNVLDDCSQIIHLGDLLSLGPRPLETLTLMLTNKVVCLMGRDDAAYANDEGDDSDEERRWLNEELGPEHKKTVQRWPYQLNALIGKQQIKLLHYALIDGYRFKDHHPGPETCPKHLHEAYRGVNSSVIVFGSDHRPCNEKYHGKHYLSPGSLGCAREPQALIIEERGQSMYISRRAVKYNQEIVREQIEAAHPPSRREKVLNFFFS